jgi:protease-4
MIERMIKAVYKNFVTKVADARGMEYDEVEKVAQGRVWTGTAGKEVGLIDELGGLETAIDLAKEAAGIPREADIELVEMPEKGAFNFDVFKPKLIGFNGLLFSQGVSDPRTTYLKMLWKHNGEPLVMLPPEYYMIGE